ncbi:hypothetical protein [Hymenobacter antarcticus]|uniref:CcmD family protein n=1 Tax=Hymenobacter antarcticus TaxID=486270 RepID=A0ABP7Q669_9BACT
MKKNLFALLTGLLLALPTLACPVCEKNQPKGFAGVTHGVGHGGPFDYVMLYGSIAVVAVTFILFFRYLLRPDNRRNQARREQLTFR